MASIMRSREEIEPVEENLAKKKKIEAVEGNLGEKKALLIGLKHPQMNDIDDVKGKILRMKKFLMDLRGFSDNNITLLIEDGDPDKSQPTDYNIRLETCYLVEHAKPGDILFIHLIAHGCSDGNITTSDKVLLPDNHFRTIIYTAGSLDCTLTIVSDCLIQPENSVCCTPAIPVVSQQDYTRFYTRHPNAKFVCVKYPCFCATGLSPVDIETPCITPTLKTHSEETSFPSSRLILLNAFQYDQKKPKEDRGPFFYMPELFLASSTTTTTPPNPHKLYGVFTTIILDIIEETQGRVTSVDLARKAMDKLRMQGIHQNPGLHSNEHHHAYASFLFAD
ncbi:uncharacterized protein LOC130734294 [Lotus japonicus]|uniref:uncharacterized protein LOC130734294 n=1 Tax=Lotus japonicus TaxID=34305 RepID=UPI00258876F8|nr:uncharacterized protein LOC130734294 [Lotus japonicus]